MGADPLKSHTFLTECLGKMDGGNVLGSDGPEGRRSLQRGCDGQGGLGRYGQGGLGRFMRLERGEVFQGGWKAVQFFRLVLLFFGSKRL